MPKYSNVMLKVWLTEKGMGIDLLLRMRLTNQPLPKNNLHHLSKSTREALISLYFLLFPNGTPPAQHESEPL